MAKKLSDIVVISAVRTPMGSFGGSLKKVTVPADKQATDLILPEQLLLKQEFL